MGSPLLQSRYLAGATSSSSSSSSPSSLSFSQRASLSPSSRYSTATITTTCSSHNFLKRCRKCGYEKETLPHVLNHCEPHYPHINCQVPETNSTLRPDLVVFNREEKKVIVVDIAVAFDNEKQALDDARQEKLLKYSDLTHELRRKGYEVQLEAFVMGSLGSMLPENHRCLRILGIKPSYARLTTDAEADGDRLHPVVASRLCGARHRLHSGGTKKASAKVGGSSSNRTSHCGDNRSGSKHDQTAYRKQQAVIQVAQLHFPYRIDAVLTSPPINDVVHRRLSSSRDVPHTTSTTTNQPFPSRT